MLKQQELIDALRVYDLNFDEDLVIQAFAFSMNAHESQQRASGEPYFSHPLEVAHILVDLHLDAYSVITGLLHDTVEDTLATLDEIQILFGPEIAKMVDGVTKLSRLEMQSEKTRQAENFRKLVLAMSSDIRILLVKLADRLHNMRTLHYVSSLDKRRRIARETMDIYVPLAERMGMQELKDELEDLSFTQLNPEARESVLSRLNFLHSSSENNIDAIMEELRSLFEAENLPVKINGREKAPYSIWRKMQNKNIAFEQLSDIMAFRIIVDTLPQCYQALGLIHNQYSVVPGRFKDYISTPKSNNYQSLHTAVIGPFSHRIEIQIRTQEMHEISEYGVAAHWNYKQNSGQQTKAQQAIDERQVDGRQYAWLRGLLEILDQASNPEEFLEHTKLEMFQDQVFCFTPKGDLISLPRGSTPIDFAYAVHSAVGNHAIAVKINGRQMPLRTILHNGDQVEVITSKTQNPSPTWERFVVTGKARSGIRRFVRSQQQEQFTELGKSILHRGFRHLNREFSEKAMGEVLERYQLSSMDDLYASVGEGLHTLHDVFRIVFPENDFDADIMEDGISSQDESIEEAKASERKRLSSGSRDVAVSIRGLISGMAVHYAGCCHPLPGDQIVGIVTTGKGVTIHTQDCDIPMLMNEPDRILDIAWEDEINDTERYVGRLKVTFLNKAGSLAAVSTAISKHQGNIVNIKVTNRSTDFWEVLLDLEVKDREQLHSIIAVLRSLAIVTYVERI